MSPAHYGKFVAYFRVSTDRQGKSGLGLEAQRKSVLDFLDGGRWSLVAEFTEVESGKRSDRPQPCAARSTVAAECPLAHIQGGLRPDRVEKEDAADDDARCQAA